MEDVSIGDGSEFEDDRSTFRAYCELLRLPNVFTAIADVLMGYLVVARTYEPLGPLLMVVATSICLYLAGMVFNDIFDREVDAKERPERPIPSGRVSLRAAWFLAVVLLGSALVLAGGLSWHIGSNEPFMHAFTIACLALGYNKQIKNTILGPIFMGGCRLNNVLLGMSAVPEAELRSMDLIVACAIGIYVMGITIFAKSEATISGRLRLASGMLVMLGGIGLIAFLPLFDFENDWRLNSLPERWPLFWALVAGFLMWRAGRAVVNPTPGHVQTAVKSSILAIIAIDAAASLTGAGLDQFSIGILLLIVPATFLGRWLYST